MTRFCCLALFFVSLVANAQTRFSYRYYALPGIAGAATHGDFDKNGWPDIAAISNEGSRYFVSILPNTSGGSFGARRDHAVSEAGPLAAADVNNDGWLDIGVAQPDSQSILLLMNNGNGTFRSGNVIFAGDDVFDLQFGDFNNDENVDLVVRGCHGSACRLRLFLGNGTGTFFARTSLTGGGSFLVNDLNRDRKLDIAEARAGKVWLWLGQGDGTFRAPRSFTVPDRDGVETIVTADFNNDSRLDLAVLSPHPCGSACGDNTVYVYKNNGDGSFTRRSSFRIGSSGFGELYTADVNGDLNMDVVARNGDHFGGFLAYALGRGNGLFDRAVDVPSSEVADFLERDWNRDSRHDIAWSEWMDSSVRVGLNSNAHTNCAPPSSARLAAKICAPVEGSTATGLVLVKASGNSPAGVKLLEVWIDGVKKYEKWGDQINKRLMISPGRHRVAVVAVDKYVGRSTAAVYVNVQ